METIKILGTQVSNVTMQQAMDIIWQFTESEGSHVIFTPNSEFIYYAYHHPEFREKLNSADLTLPDGIGVVHAAKILGTPLRERVPGYDTCRRILAESVECGCTVFILGGKPGVAEQAKENVERDFPGVRTAGVHDGYFQDDAPVIKQINAVKPDFLFVCTGCPKQEEWIYKNREQLAVKVMIGAGGTVDVLAGTVKRAPAFFCKFGLEWFYRLITQPWRFVRMLNLPKFLFTVIWKKLWGGGKDA